MGLLLVTLGVGTPLTNRADLGGLRQLDDRDCRESSEHQSLGVIDAETSSWLQNVPDVRGRNPAAFAENNHVFTVVTSAAVEDPRSPCVQFGLVGRGCIAVFGHVGDDDK